MITCLKGVRGIFFRRNGLFRSLASSRTFQRLSMSSEDSQLDHLIGSGSKIDPYWIERLKMLDRPAAKALFSQLVNDNPLGYDGAASASPSSLLKYTKDEKSKHPDKVILMRCGEFYETYGIDALMLIAYAGLNPMGNKAKAGCPLKNVQATLDGLTSVGLSVAVYEEITEIDLAKGPKKAKGKTRVLTQIVSPASSTYIYDLCLRADDIEFRENRPAVGIIKSASGYGMCQLYLDERRMIIFERLTEEGLRSILSTSGAIDPVYVQDVGDLTFLHNFPIVRINGYNEVDFPQQVLQRVGRSLEIDVSGFMISNQEATSLLRPRPIYTSTALQIGLIDNDNVPDLIPHLLPRSHNAVSARFLRKWLISPPPHRIADHMQILCKTLASSTTSMPSFHPISIGKVVSFLQARQCNVALFRDIQANVQSLLSLLINDQESVAVATVVESTLEITAFESGIAADAKQLQEGSIRVLEAINSIIAGEYDHDPHTIDPHQNIPDEFFRRNEEEYRNKICLDCPEIIEVYDEIDQAASNLCAQVALAMPPSGVELMHDMMENRIMFRTKATKATGSSSSSSSKSLPPNKDGVNYKSYVDRKGKAVANRFTSDNVETALAKYLDLVEVAPIRVSIILQALSQKLSADLVTIVQSSHFAVILQAATSHTVSALQKGWTMPELISSSSSSSASISIMSMEVNGGTPYWFSRERSVANNVELKGIFLLTAPNMSGKSTLMRSLLVIALLANCGLYVPASFARVPRYDTFFLRTASYDVPSEAKSAFALEMDDMRVVLRDCTQKSLVMIDELGKGTSARDGSALAGALLEYLDMKGVSGIFATHLHELFLLPLQLRTVTEKRMGFQQSGEVDVTWTYELEDGRCENSMALTTARQYGIDQSVITRAEQLLAAFDQTCRPDDSNQQEHAQRNEEVKDPDQDTMQNSIAEAKPPPLSTIRSSSTSTTNVKPFYDLQLQLLPILQSVEGVPSNDVIVIPPGHVPPASLEGRSAVYLLHIFPNRKSSPGVMYVGETESLAQRLKQHRMFYKRGDSSVACLAFNVADKSFARAMEAALIQALKSKGLSFDRDADAAHSLFSRSLK